MVCCPRGIARHAAVAADPTVHFADRANRAALDQLDDAVQLGHACRWAPSCVASFFVGGQFGHMRDFPDVMGKRLLQVDVLAELHGHVRGMKMRVVGRAAGDRVDLACKSSNMRR